MRFGAPHRRISWMAAIQAFRYLRRRAWFEELTNAAALVRSVVAPIPAYACRTG